jgi:hypothetical protein
LHHLLPALGKESRREQPVTSWRLFAERAALGKIFFAECFYLPSAQLSVKADFTVCLYLPRAALGKHYLCRVPDILLSAKYLALGKVQVSGSAYTQHALLKPG